MAGTIFLACCAQQVNEIQAIRAQLGRTNKSKIIVVDDMCNSNNPDIICASILLPSANTMSNLIDNYSEPAAINSFQAEYSRKLTMDQDVIEYLVVLMAGMLQYGYDYIFYIDTMNIDHMTFNVLMNVLCNSYGFILQVNNANALAGGIGIDSNHINRAMALIQNFGYAKQDQTGQLFVNLS